MKEVGAWLRKPGRDRQLYRLFGHAGTGKTTLARHLAEGVDGAVLFAAYTGKAASVLKARGCDNAQTLHSLIYHPKERSRERADKLKADLMRLQRHAQDRPDAEEQIMRLKEELSAEEKNAQRPDFTLNLESPLKDAALLVVDECSMVDETMAKDILSFGTPVLALGDPAQLPPLRGTGYFTDAKPDTMLTEIHRQAKDNPIVELATLARNGEPIRLGNYGTSSVVSKTTPELALAANQILVGRNATRRSVNRRIRQLRGHDQSPWPLAGERLVCLRNNRELGLLNGALHECLEDACEAGRYVNLRVRPEEGGESLTVPAHTEHFLGDAEQIGHWDRRDAQEFEFGYALTVHKAQGSQWGKVVLIDEWDARATRRRWLYTAITRAEESLTIVRG